MTATFTLISNCQLIYTHYLNSIPPKFKLIKIINFSGKKMKKKFKRNLYISLKTADSSILVIINNLKTLIRIVCPGTGLP